MMAWITTNKKNILTIALILLYAISLTWITNYSQQELLIMSKLRLIPYTILGICAIHTIGQGMKEEGSLAYLKNHLLLVFLLVLAGSIYYCSHNLHPIVFLVLLVAIVDTGFDTYIKPIFFTHLLFMIVTIILFKLGILEQVTIGRSGSDIVRQSLGYSYPLELQGHFFMIVLMYIYIRKKQFTIYECILINILNGVLFYFSNARTDFGLVIVLTLLALLLKLDKKDFFIHKQKLWFWGIFTVVCVVLPFVLSIHFDETSEFQVRLNRILSNRLYITNYVIEEEGLPLLGKEMEWIGFGRTGTDIQSTYNWVDFSFAKDAIDFGLLFVGVFTLGWIYLFYEKIQKRDIYGILVVMVLLLSCLIEYRSFLPHIYPMILMMAPAVMVKSNEIGKIKEAKNE